MTDDFQPSPEFRRAVDQRTRQLRRRHRFVAAAATAVIAAAVALPLGLTWGNSRTTVKVLTPPSSVPSTTTSAATTAVPSTTPTSVPSTTTPTTTPPTTTTPTTTTPPGTQVITYEPFTAQGATKIGLHVTKVVAGNCTSAGVAGNSSYRCFSGSSIYDPCFAQPGATSGPVLCPTNPATADVTQLNTGSLPAPLAGAPQQGPWAIQIANGQVCIQVNAAWGGLGPFGCQPSPPGPLADCHVPTQASPWWSADCQTQLDTSSPFTAYRVTIAWL